MSKTIKTVNFSYDPLDLSRLLLDIYAEKLEGKHTKAKQFARYDFLATMTDEELESILTRYMQEECLKYIVFEDGDKECECIFKYIYDTERYKELEFGFNKAGFGKTGFGVVDKLDNTFYDCAFSEHWSKIMEIVKEKYPHYHNALDYFWMNEKMNEFEGVTRMELDTFILETFELVSENRSLTSYLN